MKKYLLSSVALLALFAGAPAQAADLAYRNPPPVVAPAPMYNWTGFYVGANIGYDWTSGGSSAGGFMGGLQVGADYQFNSNWVVGIEGQFDWTNIKSNTLFTPLIVANANLNEVSSIAGRIGYTWGPGLLYFKGGWGWANNSLTVATLAGVPIGLTTNGNTNSGYVLGGGLEWQFAPHWSTKLEYDYYGLGSRTYYAAAFPLGANINYNIQTFMVGLNYRF